MYEISEIIGKKILVLTAHPDDESFLAGGTIYANNHAGGQTFLICATLGEKGASHLKNPLSETELQKVRHKELKITCGFLKISRVFELDFPDGGVKDHVNDLLTRTSTLLKELQPELIMSFDADGITGHNDHIAVSKVAKSLAEQHKLPLATFCLPKEVIDDAYHWLKKKRKVHEHYQNDFTLQESNLSIPIDEDIKMSALKCYKSQIDNANPFEGFPDEIASTLLKKECFCLKET